MRKESIHEWSGDTMRKKAMSLLVAVFILIPSAFSHDPGNGFSRKQKQESQLRQAEATLASTPAQEKIKLKGLVQDETGEPLIGVSILVEGTTLGTLTDVDGLFSLDVAIGQQLRLTYLGYETITQRVNSDKYLVIVMKNTGVMLDDVVVTALGIRRDKKALSYNVQELKGSEISTVKDPNFVNSLAGKVAGVQINSSSSGIGGSSRVVMRGTKSLFGDNNALYVIDGIPLISSKSEQPEDIYESPDGGDGDGIAFLNPDDIESMSVLTGAAASALYGSRGANGVILLTTKRGEKGRLRVNYNNGTSFLSPLLLPKFQNRYGSEARTFESWGRKQQGSFEPKDFFQTGYNETNSLSVSTGSETSQTYASAASLNARGIIPNNKLERYNLNLRNTTDLIKDRLTLDFSASYSYQKDLNMMAQGQYHNPLMPLYLMPRGEDFEQYKVYERYNPERNFKTQYWPYGNMGLGLQNPYWIVNRELFENRRERSSYALSLKYNILDWMSITGRGRLDNTETNFTRKIHASSDLLFASTKGNYLDRQNSEKQIYLDAMLRIDKRIDDWSLVSNIGTSMMSGSYRVIGFEGHLLTVPNLFSYNNIDKTHPQTQFIQQRYTDLNQAVFATLETGYKSLVFLDLTFRNEWASQLAFTKNTSYYYPSVGLSGIVSDMVSLPKDLISFLKVRASYSEVGNPPQRFLTSERYALQNGVLSMMPTFPYHNLKPERTKAYELGTTMYLFKNKLNLEMTYYHSDTYNQIFQVELPPSTGYNSFYLNGGKVNNWGIELTVGYKQDFGPLHWNSTVIYSMNRNKIKKLSPENSLNPINGEPIDLGDELTVSSSGSYKMMLKEGGTMGDIYVSTLKKDHNGNVYVDSESGQISADSRNWIKAGSTLPKFNLSWRNGLAYKGFELSFLFDARVGGVGVSVTQALMDRYGVSEASAQARDAGGVWVNGGKVDPKHYYSVVGGGTTGVLSEYTYSSTNVRLREASLSYTLPNEWFRGYVSDVSVSLIGRNLWLIYNKAPYDPEITASTATYYQGIDYFMQPSLRNLGFSVNLRF